MHGKRVIDIGAHQGADTRQHLCTGEPDVAATSATAGREGTPPHTTAGDRRGGDAGRAPRLHPYPGCRGTRHQPLHLPPPVALSRDDRDALGHEAHPRRRARTSHHRTPAGDQKSGTAGGTAGQKAAVPREVVERIRLASPPARASPRSQPTSAPIASQRPTAAGSGGRRPRDPSSAHRVGPPPPPRRHDLTSSFGRGLTLSRLAVRPRPAEDPVVAVPPRCRLERSREAPSSEGAGGDLKDNGLSLMSERRMRRSVRSSTTRPARFERRRADPTSWNCQAKPTMPGDTQGRDEHQERHPDRGSMTLSARPFRQWRGFGPGRFNLPPPEERPRSLPQPVAGSASHYSVGQAEVVELFDRRAHPEHRCVCKPSRPPSTATPHRLLLRCRRPRRKQA